MDRREQMRDEGERYKTKEKQTNLEPMVSSKWNRGRRSVSNWQIAAFFNT